MVIIHEGLDACGHQVFGVVTHRGAQVDILAVLHDGVAGGEVFIPCGRNLVRIKAALLHELGVPVGRAIVDIPWQAVGTLLDAIALHGHGLPCAFVVVLFRIRSLLGDIEQRASLGQTVQDGVAAVDDVRQFAGRSLAGPLVFVTIGRGVKPLDGDIRVVLLIGLDQRLEIRGVLVVLEVPGLEGDLLLAAVIPRSSATTGSHRYEHRTGTGDGEDLLHRKHTFSFPFGSFFAPPCCGRRKPNRCVPVQSPVAVIDVVSQPLFSSHR